MKKNLLFVFLGSILAQLSGSAQLADKVVRENIAGIDVIAYRMGVKDVITFRGSLPAGDAFAPKDNYAIPTLVGEMLDKGTARHDKFAIAQQLDNIGAHISYGVDGVMLGFGGKCLRKDFPLVISLLAEQLRTPAFSEEEFAKVKQQLSGDLQRALESTDYRAAQAFGAAVFPAGHPNYAPPTEEFLAAIEAAKLEDVKAFHAQYYGPAAATLVVVGDIDEAGFKAEIARAFDGWKGGKTLAELPQSRRPREPREEVLPMSDKPNIAVLIGQTTGLKYSDPDALALRVGTAVLGSGLTSRLMSTVRDKEGLSYGVGASVLSDAFTDGAWRINANFAPNLLEKGISSTMREFFAWYANGITAVELERVKTDLIGTYKVGLATTNGFAAALLSAVHRGNDLTWLDEYPKRVNALTLEEVNAAIKKHLQPDKMTVVKAGGVPPPERSD